MEKTKEIDVWVSDYDGLPKVITAKEAANGYDTTRYIKAKLIIELPEQKVEITRSQLETMLNRYYKEELYSNIMAAVDLGFEE